MIIFTEYKSGKIKVDGNEIVYDEWSTKENFPNILKKFTLVRKLIDRVIEKNDS